ncbi:MAG TPA: hypothetical protein VG013_22210 [Gemmataceae bacterium]|nr:hypothetical protein [Gemmataceae bacterium]
MKRRRQKLQVSTFPFLAVLLCAMGSLILLLLVIDLRAKAVARAKALEADAQAEADDAKIAAGAKADLERQGRLVHLRLSDQDQELLSRLRAVSGEADAAARGASQAQNHYQDMQARTQDELARLARRQAEIQARRTALSEAAKRDDAARNELARLTVELQNLERTLADLKWGRQQQQQTYSLVPYRGRQGDNRRPLYVECTAHGVVFHPDHLALEGPNFTQAQVRAEVERRIARQRAAEAPPAGPARNAYTLMLVRPDGIATYYKALDALQGLKIDYGYEFVERDWVLNFQDEESFAKQPWMADARVQGAPPTLKPLLNPSAAVAGQPPGRLQGLRSLTEGPAAPAAEPVSHPGQPADNSGLASATQVGMASNTGASAPGELHASSWSRQRKAGLRFLADQGGPAMAGGASSGPSAGSSLLADHSTSGPESGRSGESSAGSLSAPSRSGFPAAHGPGGTDTPTLTGIGAQSPGGTGQGANVSAGSAPDGLGEPDPPPVGGDGPRPAPTAGPAVRELRGNVLSGGGHAGRASSLASAGHDAKSAVGGQVPGSGQHVAAANQSQASTSDTLASPGSAPKTDSGKDTGGAPATMLGLIATQGPTTGAPAPEQAGRNSERSSQGTSHDHGGDTGGGSSGEPSLPSLLPSGVPARPNPAAVARPGLLNANRDWVIPIECRANGVMIVPGRVAFVADSLSGQGADNTLAITVRQLVQRRQAGVLPGEPPYRPLIRFLVQPDGLRSYYMAYPLLEPLQLPMARVSVHPEDEPRRGALGSDR